MKANKKQIQDFIKYVWLSYQENKRSMPWRPPLLEIQNENTLDSYAIYVSEVMLQQTQVSRVEKKFTEFRNEFSSFEKLAQAPLSKVLRVWQGMGYNRRAKYLKEAAGIISNVYKGVIPEDPILLENLPGIGPATARSIVTFIYNKPEVFIETNIRRVMIHHFFPKKTSVSDHEILPYIVKTLDRENPREWYYALMDYGSSLKRNIPNPNKQSKHYFKQSKFEGSNRQIRGHVLKILIAHGTMQKDSLVEVVSAPQKRVYDIVDEMIEERMVMEKRGNYLIYDTITK